MTKYVYTFGKGRAEGSAEMRELLGGKGAGLAEMARLGFPIPPGLTITTEACAHYLEHRQAYPAGLETQVAEGIRAIEKMLHARFGDPKMPLLLAVRSGAAASMPGMMDTILNLGLNDATVEGLIHCTDNPRFGFDSYRRFIQMYGDVVFGVPRDLFEHRLQAAKERQGARNDMELTARDWEGLVAEYKEVVATECGRPFPQDPLEQLWGAIGAVFASWNRPRAVEYRRIHHLAHRGGTACTVQAMVFGNLNDRSATGVAFTRDPATGRKRFFGEFLLNAQGEDVVAGVRTPQPIHAEEGGSGPSLQELLPECCRELDKLYHKLERHYRDMQDLEFTIQDGKLWLLQTRAGKRTATAAVKIAVDMVAEGQISREEALLRITPQQLEQLLHPTIDPAARIDPVAVGLAASPGGACGRIVFSADTAVAWQQQGEAVILVRPETSPDDIHGMHVAQGLLTARGGLTSHAAVVARGMGKPCVVGCEALRIDPVAKELRVKGAASPIAGRQSPATSGSSGDRTPATGDQVFKEGDWLTINGSTGEVIAGQVPMVQPDIGGEFTTLMAWADDLRLLKVRANAETPQDVAMARQFGAEGIGLVRTEHMFFDPARILLMREMIVATDLATRKQALTRLLPMQRADFQTIFRLMAGLPVTVRLLDLPLHEFLPNREEEIADLAATIGVPCATLGAQLSGLREFNPMLGHRGCRLGVTQPEIYGMQTQAILEAVCELKRAEGIESLPEIEIPLICHVHELKHLRALVERVAEEVIARTGVRVPYRIGTMIELPRAALVADQLARYADFFSFGTNDLTQTAFGISRDDAGQFLRAYVEKQIFPSDPFVSIDLEGVGQLIQLAVTKGRAVKPELEIGICGEHGGEPASIGFCHRLGLQYVSCSPYRVPIARLAAAQAVLTNGQPAVKGEGI